MGDEEGAERWHDVGNLGADRQRSRLYIYKHTQTRRLADGVILSHCQLGNPGHSTAGEVLKNTARFGSFAKGVESILL